MVVDNYNSGLAGNSMCAENTYPKLYFSYHNGRDERLLKLIRDRAGTNALHFLVSHAAVPEAAERFSELLRQEFNCLSLVISDFSPVMGYGAGPGALFVGFHPELDLFK